MSNHGISVSDKRRIHYYEIRYRKISELFIYQYSSIFINNANISKLFQYVNPCTFMQFHGRLVRRFWDVAHTENWFITTAIIIVISILNDIIIYQKRLHCFLSQCRRFLLWNAMINMFFEHISTAIRGLPFIAVLFLFWE